MIGPALPVGPRNRHYERCVAEALRRAGDIDDLAMSANGYAGPPVDIDGAVAEFAADERSISATCCAVVVLDRRPVRDRRALTLWTVE